MIYFYCKIVIASHLSFLLEREKALTSESPLQGQHHPTRWQADQNTRMVHPRARRRWKKKVHRRAIRATHGDDTSSVPAATEQSLRRAWPAHTSPGKRGKGRGGPGRLRDPANAPREVRQKHATFFKGTTGNPGPSGDHRIIDDNARIALARLTGLFVGDLIEAVLKNLVEMHRLVVAGRHVSERTSSDRGDFASRPRAEPPSTCYSNPTVNT